MDDWQNGKHKDMGSTYATVRFTNESASTRVYNTRRIFDLSGRIF